MAAYNTAILLSDNSLLAHQNLGTLLMNTGNFHAAEKHFSRVLVLRPADGKAHLKMALALLAQGHFKEGWEHWEWRYFSESFLENNKIRIVPFPRWDGSSLAGKNVLLNPEQGIGDEIMFASCFRDVIAQANHVVIECDPRLLSLFQRSFPGTEVVPSDSSTDFYRSQSLPTIDWRIQTGSLPRFFRPDLEHFSGASAYIAVDEVRKEMWSKRLSKLDKPVNIGISWRGGTIVHARFARSIPLEKWGALFACNKANFINLQYGDHAAEIAANSQND
jgi:tetratricopeptide (TPR) repeat protein